jgi:UDP-glucose:glycoprotein glucosyltransferase
LKLFLTILTRNAYNSETIATHNESAYFDFLQDFISLEQKSTSLTPQQVYEEALKVVSSLGNDETNFFKLSLAIHEAAPRMEAYNQYYRESVMPALSQYDDQCKVWVQLGNRQFCDIHQFTDALSQEKNTAEAVDILPFDHVVYSPGATKKAPNVVIYTDRFSAQFEEFYKALNDVHDLSYIIRYRPSILPSSSPLYLAGYGVEMALKKTDYLVIDDRSSQGMKGRCCYMNAIS